MQSAQKCSRMKTSFQPIPIHNVPPFEEDRKSEQVGRHGSSDSYWKEQERSQILSDNSAFMTEK